MDKLPLPALSIERLSLAPKKQDLGLDDLTINRFTKALSRKLRSKHETIDRWKERYDEEHKLITPVGSFRSRSVKMFNQTGSNIFVDAKRKSLHASEVKPRLFSYIATICVSRDPKERVRMKWERVLTPRKWEIQE